MSDINNKFVDFMNKSDFLFDEREVSIKTFNFVSEQYFAEIQRLQKQNDSMREALEEVYANEDYNWIGKLLEECK